MEEAAPAESYPFPPEPPTEPPLRSPEEARAEAPGDSSGAATTEPALFPEWSRLLVDAAQVRVKKRKAAAEEDFAAALQLKKREIALAAKLKHAEAFAKPEGREQALRQLEGQKRKAVDSQDFVAAGDIKRRQQQLKAVEGVSLDAARSNAFVAACALAVSGSDAAAVLQELHAPNSTPDVPRVVAPKASSTSPISTAGGSAKAGASAKRSAKPAQKMAPEAAANRSEATEEQAQHASSATAEMSEDQKVAAALLVSSAPVKGRGKGKGKAPREKKSAAPASGLSAQFLWQFLTAPGRLPHDQPLPFSKLLEAAPPGTEPMALVRMMSVHRDDFRENAGMFCVCPKLCCGDWIGVNPYSNPVEAPAAANTGGQSGAVPWNAASDEE